MPISKRAEQDHLREEQYKDSSNLNARAELHRRFSVNTRGWLTWVWDQMDMPAASRVLDIGSGPGWLWYEHTDRINQRWHVTLSDFSPGMVAEQRSHLADSGLNIDFQVIDMQSIPFEDDTFDIVIANHMLYHVPDQAKGIDEVRRVLKPGGTFYAATNGVKHMQEIDEIILHVFPKQHENIETADSHNQFSLENGGAKLAVSFDTVEVSRYDDGLHVTEVEPLMGYILSGLSGADGLNDAQIAQLRAEVQRRMDVDGAVDITKDSGLFVCS